MAFRRRAVVGASLSMLLVASCAEFTNFDGLEGPPLDASDGGQGPQTLDGARPSADANGFNNESGANTNDAGNSGQSDASGSIDAPVPPLGITFVGVKDKDGTETQATSVNVASPATAAGQLLIAIAYAYGESAVTAPTGFSAATSASVSGSEGVFVSTFYKIAAAADVGATYTFQNVESDGVSAIVAAYAGASTSSPIANGAASATGGSTMVTPTTGAWVVGAVGLLPELPCSTWKTSTGTTERVGESFLMLGDSNGASTSGAFGGSCGGSSGMGSTAFSVAVAIAPQ